MTNLVLIGSAVVAIAAVVAAFAIAWRRSGGKFDWKAGVSDETVRADRSRHIELPRVPTEAQPAEPEPEAVEEQQTAPTPEPVAVAVTTEQRLAEASPEEVGVTRRQFFNRAMGATWFTFLGILGLDMLAFTWPKLSGGFGSDVNAGNVANLLEETHNDDGTVSPVFVPEARAYVVPAPVLGDQFAGKSVEVGGVMALYQRCVHLGCRVPWCQTSQGFECPCHGTKYSLLGEFFAGPAPRNLDRFVVELNSAEDLIIKTGSIIQTPRAQVLVAQYPKGPSCIGAAGAEEA